MSQNKELPLVVCSVDGALLGQHGRLLACDELTIRLYCAMGGQFSALTYRTPQGLEALFPGKNWPSVMSFSIREPPPFACRRAGRPWPALPCRPRCPHHVRAFSARA